MKNCKEIKLKWNQIKIESLKKNVLFSPLELQEQRIHYTIKQNHRSKGLKDCIKIIQKKIKDKKKEKDNSKKKKKDNLDCQSLKKGAIILFQDKVNRIKAHHKCLNQNKIFSTLRIYINRAEKDLKSMKN